MSESTGKLKKKAWSDDEFVWRTLQRNKDKNFVRRAISPEKSPYMPNPYGKGVSSLLMSSAEVGKDRTPIAYPEIVQKDGKLSHKAGRAAITQAQDTGELIKFRTPGDAEHFASGYKRAWSMKQRYSFSKQ